MSVFPRTPAPDAGAGAIIRSPRASLPREAGTNNGCASGGKSMRKPLSLLTALVGAGFRCTPGCGHSVSDVCFSPDCFCSRAIPGRLESL